MPSSLFCAPPPLNMHSLSLYISCADYACVIHAHLVLFLDGLKHFYSEQALARQHGAPADKKEPVHLQEMSPSVLTRRQPMGLLLRVRLLGHCESASYGGADGEYLSTIQTRHPLVTSREFGRIRRRCSMSIIDSASVRFSSTANSLRVSSILCSIPRI